MMENSLCFCIRLRGICVPHTLWWPLSSLTWSERDHDIVQLRAVTWHCKISQIRSLIGWFEIWYEMTHKNTFRYKYLLMQLHDAFELQNTYKSWHGLASLLSFNFTVTYGISNFFIAKAYMNVFFFGPVLSCPVSIKSCYVVQKSPLNEMNSSQSRSSSNLCGLTYCSSFSSTKDRFVSSNIHLISKLVTW